MKNKSVRLRFAPSPTGPLHIGGVRTALYNYLMAKKNNGSFILRIEDTDQSRYVPGAEEYIQDALKWCGLILDEGPEKGGDYGPYRQSERTEIYKKYASELVNNGKAYKAFDTPEELDAKRAEAQANGNHNWQYDAKTRGEMRNSLSLSPAEVDRLEQDNMPFVIRFKMPENHTVHFVDQVRGEVSFDTNVLDDKVLYKADGYPTYHMANVIDDHLMAISDVVRGEEWLSSTPLHILLYEALGWEDTIPKFAHLPLILKPVGQGKLSKRDGAKFGFPVFPLTWEDPETKEVSEGFKETGFLAEGLDNFLAFLGWNPGTEDEIFNLDQMVDLFSIDRVSKAGARFDYEKALWFNQQHIQRASVEELLPAVSQAFNKVTIEITPEEIASIIRLFQDRVHLIPEFVSQSAYITGDVPEYDEKMIKKKWKPEQSEIFRQLIEQLQDCTPWTSAQIEDTVKHFMTQNNLGFGQVLPILRLAICGTMQGPVIFDVMQLLGQEKTVNRLNEAIPYFNTIKKQ